MSDQKKWFKVWGSILVDPSMTSLSLSDMGRWVRLGAYISTSGERGKLTIVGPAPMFLLAMQVESLADAKMALKRLPNVQVSDINNDNGGFIVIMRNWFKYQVDSTAYERVKRSRHKKRGEEKLTSTSTSTPSAARRGASLEASRQPLAENGKDEEEKINQMTCQRCDYHVEECKCEELEQRERNRQWQNPNTTKPSNESVATSQEIHEILDKWRKENPRGGKH